MFEKLKDEIYNYFYKYEKLEDFDQYKEVKAAGYPIDPSGNDGFCQGFAIVWAKYELLFINIFNNYNQSEYISARKLFGAGNKLNTDIKAFNTAVEIQSYVDDVANNLESLQTNETCRNAVLKILSHKYDEVYNDIIQLETTMKTSWEMLNNNLKIYDQNEYQQNKYITSPKELAVDSFIQDLRNYRKASDDFGKICKIKCNETISIRLRCQLVDKSEFQITINIDNSMHELETLIKNVSNNNYALNIRLANTQNGAGHAISVCAFNNKIYWFDPNYGVYRSNIYSGLCKFIYHIYSKQYDKIQTFCVSLQQPTPIEDLSKYVNNYNNFDMASSK